MKKIVVLLVIFLGLGAFVYFYEIRGKGDREEAQRLEESLLRIQESEVTGLVIERPEKETVRLAREGDNWVLAAPLKTTADGTTVSSFVRTLENARRIRSFAAEEAAKLEDYGLDSPRLTLRVKTADGEKVVQVGNEDFTGSNVYVRVEGEPEIFLTGKTLFSSADKELFDWRNKEVLAFDRDKVKIVEISRGTEEIRLSKQGEEWKLEAPLQEPADRGAVSSLLSTLSTARVQAFVSEAPESLAQYGLDRPAVTLRLQQEGEDRWRSLYVGKKQEEAYFAANPDRSPVFTIRDTLYEKLTEDVWEYRQKKVVNVDQDKVSQVTLKRDGEEIVVRHDDFKWIVEQPESYKGREALSYKFWYPIEDIEFTSIQDHPAGQFPAPEVVLVLKLDDGSSRNFEFARQGDRHLARQADTGRQGTISQEAYEKLTFQLEEILAEETPDDTN